jgi:hypothetical protein
LIILQCIVVAFFSHFIIIPDQITDHHQQFINSTPSHHQRPRHLFFLQMELEDEEGSDNDTLTCCRCQHVYNYSNDRIPKYLFCMHTICLKCVTELSLLGNDGYVLCPLCGQLTVNKREETQTYNSFLPTNFRLSKLLHKKTNICDNCDTNTACTKCLDCDDDCSRLCINCLKNHKKLKAFRDHRFVDLSSHYDGDQCVKDEEQSHSTTTQKETFALCSKHSMKPLNMYCMSCCTTLCLSCAAFGHEGHHILSHTQRASLEREAMQDSMKSLELNTDVYRQTKLDVENQLFFLADQKRGMMGDMTDGYNVLLGQFKSQQETLMSQSIALCTQHHDSLQTRIKQTTSLVLFCERFIYAIDFFVDNNVSDNDILEVKRLFMKAHQEIEKMHRQCTSLIPPLSYFDDTFEELKCVISTCATTRSAVSNSISPGNSTLSVILNGNFTSSSWRLVLLLTLPQTPPISAADHIPITATAKVTEIESKATRFEHNKNLKTMGEKTENGHSNESDHKKATNTGEEKNISAVPNVDFSIHILNNRNGTYHIFVSCEQSNLVALLASLNYGISVSVKIFDDVHAHNSPFVTTYEEEHIIREEANKAEEDQQAIAMIIPTEHDDGNNNANTEENITLVDGLLEVLPAPAASFLSNMLH